MRARVHLLIIACVAQLVVMYTRVVWEMLDLRA